MLMMLGRSAIIAVSLVLLAGCYLSTERLIEHGADIGLDAGTYVCRGSDSETIVLGKRREATATGIDTVYTVERTDYRFAALRPGLWLVQGTESSNYSYSFVDFSDRDRLRILAQDPKAGPALKALAERHRLKLEAYLGSDDSVALLKGSAADIRTFLLAHEAARLVERMNCRR